MTKIYLFALALLCSFVSIGQVTTTGSGNVSVTALGTAYTENFNTLGTATSSGSFSGILPTGWYFSESDQNNNSTYGIDDGNVNSGNTYSYGSFNSTDRAFGTLLSGNLVSTIGVRYTNNTGSTINSITISYTGEQWRLGFANRGADRLEFQYSTTASAINTGTYTAVSNLNFSSPITTGTVGGLNGNAAENRTAVSYTITGVSIPNNSSIIFRWNDFNVSNSDDGLAIDDFNATFNTAISQPACTAPTAQPTGITFSNTTSTAFDINFTAASPIADEYLALVSTSNTLSATPANGTAYNVNDAIGNAIVAYRGSGDSFSETNLTPGTTYYVYIFSLNSVNCSGGPSYNISNPATNSQVTTALQPCTAPATQVNNIAFNNISNTSVSGTYTAATDADGYLVIVSTNATLGFTPANGISYAVGSSAGNGTVIKNSAGTTFSVSNLTANTTYHFSFFTLNSNGCTGGPAYNTSPVNSSTSTTNNSTGIPVGYYDAITTQTCAPLKTALKVRTTTGHTPKTYTNLWAQYLISDVKPREVGPGTSANVIWDIYSDNPNGTDPYNFTPGPTSGGGQQDGGGNGNTEGLLYNREHSVPVSWFNGNTDNDGPATDYLHIYPTDKYVNAQRGNLIYGEITNPTNTYRNGSKMGPNAFSGLSGTAFEPINEYKGDLARSFFYFITRYEDLMPNTSTTYGTDAFEQNTYPSVDNAYLRLMLKWHEQDPVSAKEIDRNNAAFTYQGNRNPYIDHPEYVARAWNGGCAGVILPVDLIAFKGTLAGSKVFLNWEVANENNLQQYVIERSENGRSYTVIGSVKAANLSAYQYSDDISNLTGRRLYYRLKKQDKDDKFTYSDVFTVHIPLKLSFSVYPNPVVNGIVNLQLAKATTANSYLQVLDITGKVYQQMPVKSGITQLKVNVKSLASGTYLVRFTDADGTFTTQKIQVQ